MNWPPVVVSVFPGIGLLDRAFEEEGFCVVRGPDLLWGGDIRRFHVPAGVFNGVIGGPPCQWWSNIGRVAKARGQEVTPDRIPEYNRVVGEAQPDWFVMENVPQAPRPSVEGYIVRDAIWDTLMCGGVQHRDRRISFGTREGIALAVPHAALVAHPQYATLTKKRTFWDSARQRPASSASTKNFPDALRAQGLPDDFLADTPLTSQGKFEVVAQGVPLPMGRAIARAVKAAMYPNLIEASA